MSTTTSATLFTGWPADGLALLAELAEHNTREFWEANKHRYRDALLTPTRALGAALEPEFGPLRVFRPHVDRRFRPDAPPYRTDTGGTATGAGGVPFVVVLAVGALSVQVGHWSFDAAQLRRYRDAVAGPAGEQLDEVLEALAALELRTDAVRQLAGRPRGCPPDHPRLHLLRHRGLHVDRAWAAGPWLQTAEPLDRVREAWRAAEPLAGWLDRNVGPREPVA